MKDAQTLAAYLATLLAIVVLTLAGAAVCIFMAAADEVGMARIIGALAFISAAVAGLVGVIGTFRPRTSNEATDTALGDAIAKIPPATIPPEDRI